MRLVAREMVRHARRATVQVGAAEVFGAHHLARRRLHQRRAAQEDRAVAAHDHRLVRHRRHVRAARRARAEHDRDLADPLRRHAGLVVEDAAEVLSVGEDVRLPRQVGAARVDEVHAGQPVLRGDLLRAQVLLHRDRVVRPAFDRRVVGDDHHLPAGDHPDARDDAATRHLLRAVHLVAGEGGELEEGGARVDERLDPLPGEHLAAGGVKLRRALAAALRRARGDGAKPRDEAGHRGGVGLERGAPRVRRPVEARERGGEGAVRRERGRAHACWQKGGRGEARGDHPRRLGRVAEAAEESGGGGGCGAGGRVGRRRSRGRAGGAGGGERARRRRRRRSQATKSMARAAEDEDAVVGRREGRGAVVRRCGGWG
mmetsp:Transcript_7424/g.17919  ORF Transcript_7424/g.17919 Transcript_7424/m.17919 type:complete len:372 (+) Transcript_7424:1242-2357(+)